MNLNLFLTKQTHMNLLKIKNTFQGFQLCESHISMFHNSHATLQCFRSNKIYIHPRSNIRHALYVEVIESNYKLKKVYIVNPIHFRVHFSEFVCIIC